VTDRAPHPLIAIVGPTGSGKSALALRIARELSGEIVSCDSLQVYRGLDIGSAKATPEERGEVRHHLLDVVEPDEEFSAAEYARQGRAALIQIAARGRLPIVAGGTGLYLKALLQGLFEGPARNPPLRRRLEALAERHGDARLHRLLERIDAESAARLAPRDRVRIVRALEVFWATGRSLTAHHREGQAPLRGFSTLVLGLAPDRAELRQRVERRTHEMFERGLLDEVRGLLARGLLPDLRPLRAIGYRQAVAVALGRLGRADAERETVAETLRFAKRQMTWFRHQAEVTWYNDADAAARGVHAWLEDKKERS
jgi:tRNA dimethylallyltransferase